MGKWWGDILSFHWTKKHFWALASASFYRKLTPNVSSVCVDFWMWPAARQSQFKKKHLSCLRLIFKNKWFGPDILDGGNFIPHDHSSFVRSKYRYDRRWLPIVIFIYWAGEVAWERSCYIKAEQTNFLNFLPVIHDFRKAISLLSWSPVTLLPCEQKTLLSLRHGEKLLDSWQSDLISGPYK